MTSETIHKVCSNHWAELNMTQLHAWCMLQIEEVQLNSDKKHDDAHNDAHAQEASILLVFYTV